MIKKLKIHTQALYTTLSLSPSLSFSSSDFKNDVRWYAVS